MSTKLKRTQCAGGLIIFPDQSIVLIKRPNGLAFPKGHVEPKDKSLEAAALREVREETAYRPEIVAYLGLVSRESIERNGEKVVKDIALYLMHGKADATLDPEEVPVRVPLDVALQQMHFPGEASFLADHAATIVEQTMQLAS